MQSSAPLCLEFENQAAPAQPPSCQPHPAPSLLVLTCHMPMLRKLFLSLSSPHSPPPLCAYVLLCV